MILQTIQHVLWEDMQAQGQGQGQGLDQTT